MAKGGAGQTGIIDPGHHNEKRQKQKAIDALRVSGSKALAATAAQISMEALNNWRKTDDEFQHEWDVAVQAYIADLKATPIEDRPRHYWHLDVPDNVLTIKEQALEFASQGYSNAGIAARLGISTTMLTRFASDDASFKAELGEAREAGTDFLEDEARRRGVDGVDKPVFHQGMVVGYTKEYSDGLLSALIRSRRPSWRPQMILAQGGDQDKVLEICWKEPEPPAIENNPAPSNEQNSENGGEK